MAVVGTLNVSGAGTRRPSSIEDNILDGEGTLISAMMVRKLDAGRGVPSRLARAEVAVRMISKQ